jgi:large subunit ribosomal protein L10
MPRSEKAAAVADLAEAFRGSSAAVLTEYRGLTVAQLAELRGTLSGTARYAVVKNTLTRLAAHQAGVADIDELLTGPSAVAFVSGDPVAAAKSLRDFARANPALIVKGGLLEGRSVSAEDFRRLADLESREVLLARLAGAMTASLSQAAALFSAPLAQVARLAAALRDKLPAETVPETAGTGEEAGPLGAVEDENAGAETAPTDSQAEAEADVDAPPAEPAEPTDG